MWLLHSRKTLDLVDKNLQGFTLIELMVVIVILGILAGLIVPRLTDKPEKARVVKAKLQIENLSMALKEYKIDNGFYPSTQQGLKALVQKPSIGRIPSSYPNQGYISQVPADPWGNPYVYICPGEHADYDLLSLGADGEEGGEEFNKDIKSWDLE
ncbi:MAG TPA: type II secretion system major pseudopilin GspG [Desulfohalobiaceae bacterium]|nr:type II secretion system major pseudopilin GspG [Desulfohalobiaceae bacterium]